MIARLLSALDPRPGSNWLVRLLERPLTAGIIALILLSSAAFFTFQGDQINRSDKVKQATVQAETLASGIAAPLAFNDQDTLREYLDALHADPQILAVGAYDAEGQFVAGYQTSAAQLPGRGYVGRPTATSRDLVVTAAVNQGGTRLGSVYLRASMDSWTKRVARYAGLAALVLMAALLIATLGTSYASLTEAHRQLKVEIANRLQAEEALRQSQKMEALGQLTGGVAHDFNNLLMVASGSLELMERTNDVAKLDRLKSSMRQAINRGAELTQQLLSFSRRSPVKLEVIDMGCRVGGMTALLDQLATNNISLAIDIQPGIWPIEVDPSELDVALLNLVVNAKDALPEGGAISIIARNQPDENQVLIEVTDQGTGIPPEVLDRVFDPFFTTKGPGRGTGLGLSQVYGFARASGGEAKIRSAVGKGTTVSLIIPRSLKKPPVPEASAPVVQEVQSRKILLVEDNDTVAEMVGTMLAEIGYETERQPSADAALKRLGEGADFSLVLSDMVMPGERGGLELVREIADRWPQLPYVLMTGYSEASATAQREKIPLIAKPFTLEKLSAIVGERISKALLAAPAATSN